jgi:hypothetical protein
VGVSVDCLPFKTENKSDSIQRIPATSMRCLGG